MDQLAFVIVILPYLHIMVVACHDVQALNDGPSSAKLVLMYVDCINVLIPNNKNVSVLTVMRLVDQMNVFNVSQVIMHSMGTV